MTYQAQHGVFTERSSAGTLNLYAKNSAVQEDDVHAAKKQKHQKYFKRTLHNWSIVNKSGMYTNT